MSNNLKQIIKKANTPLEKMSDFQLSRWAALVEAVNLIADKAEDRGLKFNKMSLKQSALRDYVNITGDIICRRIQEEKIGSKK